MTVLDYHNLDSPHNIRTLFELLKLADMYICLYKLKTHLPPGQVHDGQAEDPVRVRPGGRGAGQQGKYLQVGKAGLGIFLLLQASRQSPGKVCEISQKRNIPGLRNSETIRKGRL